jgi:hypothetical protein
VIGSKFVVKMAAQVLRAVFELPDARSRHSFEILSAMYKTKKKCFLMIYLGLAPSPMGRKLTSIWPVTTSSRLGRGTCCMATTSKQQRTRKDWMMIEYALDGFFVKDLLDFALTPIINEMSWGIFVHNDLCLIRSQCTYTYSMPEDEICFCFYDGENLGISRYACESS